MRRFRFVWMLAAVTGILPLSCARAGVLNGHPQAFDDGNGPAGGAWSGVGTYSHPFASGHLDGTIEWAVFGPGQFPYAGLNGWIPVSGQLTYAYQIINTGQEGIANFTFQGALTGFDNGGAASLGGANESPLYAAFTDSGSVQYEFTSYDPDTDEYVGTPVPATTGISVGLVLSSTRVPVSGLGDVTSYEGVLHPTIRPVIAVPNGSLYVPPASADYNNNGTVDAADYVLWRKGDLAADGTGPGGTPDGVVNGLDYSFWRAAFGQPAGSGSSMLNSAVPEPNAVALGLMSLLAILRRPRR